MEGGAHDGAGTELAEDKVEPSEKAFSTVSRSSHFCPISTKTYDNFDGSFKFHNRAWRPCTGDDIQHLNEALFYCSTGESTSENEDGAPSISQLLSRFFPQHPLIAFASSLSKSSRTLSSLRGHPVVVEFQYPSNWKGSIAETTAQQSPCNPDALPRTLDKAASSPAQSDVLPRLSAGPAPRFDSPPGQRLEVPSVLFPDPCSATSGSEIDSDVSSSPGLHSPSTTTALTYCPVEDVGEEGQLPIRMTFEFSSGLCVVRKRGRCHACSQGLQGSPCSTTASGCGVMEALVLRRNDDLFYELPKGHLEHGETLEEGAERELREETGLLNPVAIGEPLLSEIYAVRTWDGGRLEKTVHYFAATLLPCPPEKLTSAEEIESSNPHSGGKTGADVFCENVCRTNNAAAGVSADPLEAVAVFGKREAATKELMWVCLDDVTRLFWKSNTVMRVIRTALTRKC